MRETSWLEIDLSCLDANVAALRAIIGPATEASGRCKPWICAVIKADAYGLGAVPIAKRLVALGVEMLAVYSLDQGRDLVANGIDHPLLFLMPVRDLGPDDSLAPAARNDRVHLTIHDPAQFDAVEEIGRRLGCRIPVHLFLDTGMSRSGLNANQAADLLRRIPGSPNTRLAGILSHLATANDDIDFANEQAARLDRFLDDNQQWIDGGVLIHLANTAATLRSRTFHRSMVRTGLGILGYGDDLLQGGVLNERVLRPTVRWLARINHIQHYTRGTKVGYSCTHELERDSVLGVVPTGHADGYPWSLGNRSVVRVPGRRGGEGFDAPVVGQVSMDQMVVDLTNGFVPRAGQLPGAGAVQVGDVVELISNDPLSPCALPRLAELAGTCCYEMLCRLSPRLTRCYLSTHAPPTPSPWQKESHSKHEIFT